MGKISSSDGKNRLSLSRTQVKMLFIMAIINLYYNLNQLNPVTTSDFKCYIHARTHWGNFMLNREMCFVCCFVNNSWRCVVCWTVMIISKLRLVDINLYYNLNQLNPVTTSDFKCYIHARTHWGNFMLNREMCFVCCFVNNSWRCVVCWTVMIISKLRLVDKVYDHTKS